MGHMCIPWKKLKKDEKMMYANHKIKKGAAVFLFGGIWYYFASRTIDVWSALPQTIAIMGLLLVLYGLVKRTSV